MPRSRRIVCATLGILLAALAAMAPTTARAGPALVFDVRSGDVLHAYMPFQRWYPASLTKLMTVYVSLRAIREGRASLSTPVRVSARALREPPSRMGLPLGTTLSLDYAMRIIMVRSANDISVAIAETVSGDNDAFIRDMNAASARLGMTDTRWVNAHGLPDERQITTARDMGLLVRALINEFPQYQYLFEMQSIRVGDSVLANTNKLIGRFPGADGMKTGYICSSAFNLASSATRNGRRIAAIVLGARNANHREQVTAGLLDAAFQTRSGLRLFGSSRKRLNDLARPASMPGPVDMCPYLRGGRSMPAHIASFGTDATGRPSAEDLARPGMAGSDLALADARVMPLGGATPARPVRAFAVPMPRPRPVTAGTAAVLPPAAAQGDGAGVPAPDPLRSRLH